MRRDRPDLNTPARARIVRTADLTADEIDALRALLWAAFDRPGDPDEGFSEDDWRHALGGRHVLVEAGGRLVAHAAIVERPIDVGARRLRTGYVEAVATLPAEQRRGHGRLAMVAANDVIAAGFEIGMLGTGLHRFYERLGWRTWRGPSFVRTPAGLVATPDDDGYIMVLPTPRTPVELDPVAPISCDWRPGDAW